MDNIQEQCLCRDVVALTKLSRRIEQRRAAGQTIDRDRQKRRKLIDASRATVEQRRKRVPPSIQIPPLPIAQHWPELLQVCRDHQVIVIAGETGCGKTTQLPKLLLQLGYGTRGMIGCTQPRRLAATSVASRLVEEMNGVPGDLVGYQIRFEKRTSPNTLIKFMTDGILLAETQSDRYLSSYDTIIVDEAHEP